MTTFKKVVGWLHLWLGLATGIVVFILSVTGCILVFEEEIKIISSPWRTVERPEGKKFLPPSQLYQAASQALPGKSIRSVWYHGHEHSAHVSSNSDSLLYINPYTAEVIALVDHEDFFHIIEEGHFWLWMPQEIGHAVTGWSTLIFFILLLTGLILWWPKKWNSTNRAKSFSIKWKARWKRINYDLHNVLGFYALIIALILAFTGLMMSFAWFNKGVYWLSSGGAARVEYIKPFSDTLSIQHTPDFSLNADRAFIKGMTELAVKNKNHIIVSFPKKSADPVYVCVDMINGDWRDVFLDQNTLEVLPASDKQRNDLNVNEWISRSNYALHVGAIGGTTTQILYFIASLICATLPITGLIVWLQRGKSKVKN
jgi:uncharacterized iron-regulated membrane protein